MCVICQRNTGTLGITSDLKSKSGRRPHCCPFDILKLSVSRVAKIILRRRVFSSFLSLASLLLPAEVNHGLAFLQTPPPPPHPPGSHTLLILSPGSYKLSTRPSSQNGEAFSLCSLPLTRNQFSKNPMKEGEWGLPSLRQQICRNQLELRLLLGQYICFVGAIRFFVTGELWAATCGFVSARARFYMPQ